jgi:hypothetical protein
MLRATWTFSERPLTIHGIDDLAKIAAFVSIPEGNWRANLNCEIIAGHGGPGEGTEIALSPASQVQALLGGDTV